MKHRVGITFATANGLGDKVQFTSIPENFYKHYGHKIIDVDRQFVFDFNPYVDRVNEPVEVIDIWKRPTVIWSPDERSIATSNAEIHSRLFGWYPVVMNRPRLYYSENYPFFQREKIILHVKGVAQGPMPEHVVRHVSEKYGPRLSYIGKEEDWIYDMPAPSYIKTPTFWDLAKVISQARIFIGLDSGPAWVSSCYPDVITKKVRSTLPIMEELKNFVPLEFCQSQSHWDDRAAGTYNVSEDDLGFTWSYKRL